MSCAMSGRRECRMQCPGHMITNINHNKYLKFWHVGDVCHVVFLSKTLLDMRIPLSLPLNHSPCDYNKNNQSGDTLQ